MRLCLCGVAIAAAACTSRPHFDPAQIDSAVLGKGLPAGFLLGTATAAHQVEGGNANDWTDWDVAGYSMAVALGLIDPERSPSQPRRSTSSGPTMLSGMRFISSSKPLSHRSRAGNATQR